MDFNTYQSLMDKTRNKNLNHEQGLAMMGLGLGGEAGECSDLLKKHLFHGHELDREKLVKELGDVLWYVAGVALLAGVSFDEVAEKNIAKLKARYPDGFTSEASVNRAQET